VPDDLKSWLDGLSAGIANSSKKNPVRLSNRAQRGLFPGFGPVDIEGVVRAYAMGQPMQQFGKKPEVPSIVQWMQMPETNSLDGLPSSIGALLTLAADRRIEVIPESTIKYEDQPETLFVGYADSLDPRLRSPVPDDLDTRLIGFAERLLGMPADATDVILRAMNLHYASVLVFESSVDAAYTLAVAGIEALAERQKSDDSWETWDQAPHWDKKFRAIGLTDEQGTAIRTLAMKDRRTHLSQGFVDYVISNLPEEFWTEPFVYATYQIEGGNYTGGSWSDPFKMSERLARDELTLSKRLKLTYGARSRHVHSGAPTGSFADQAFWIVGNDSDSRAYPYAVVRSMLRWLLIDEISRYVPAELPIRNLRDPSEGGASAQR